MSETVISVIRTVVPAIVGLIVATAANVGIDIDNEALVSVLNGVVIGGYYLVARWLEGRSSSFGWLLGYPAAPSYDK